MIRQPELHRALLFVFLACGLVGPARGDQFDPVRERINKALQESNLPSIAVAVAHKGEIIWEEGFGLADRERGTPATEHTMYSVASVSKPITATGLMVLVDRGLVDLDRPIDEYLGDAKLNARVGDASEATVRRVANHTSGLPLHYQFFYENEPHSPPGYEETIRRYANLVTAPGERYQYSNLGYGILDYVIERVGQKSYADFMREEVFLPLGMLHTSIDVGPGLEEFQAIRYTPEGKRIPFYTFDHAGASAVYSSAHDLARFAMFHMREHLDDQRPILKDASIEAMQVPTSDKSGNGGYGIGWGSFDNKRGYHCVQHTGGMPGVATTVRFVPQERLAVVVLANSRSPLAYGLPDMITDILLPEKEQTEEEKAEEKLSEKSGEKGDRENAGDGKFAPSAELVGKWTGELVTYQKRTPLRLTVEDDGDVKVRLGQQLTTLLNNVSFGDGYLRGRFAARLPYEDHRGRDYTVQLELKLRDNKLNGSATTHTDSDGWGSNAVTHWAEVRK